MNTRALIFHAGYTHIEVALASEEKILEQTNLPKHQASRDLIPAVDRILQRSNLTTSHLSFLGAHQGPGPFTTLRVSIASINGLAYATSLPLVGINGLDAFILEQAPMCATRHLAIMLNAFCDDVYYAIHDTVSHTTTQGCAPIGTFIELLRQVHTQAQDNTRTWTGDQTENREHITCMGNAVTMHREHLALLGEIIVVPEHIPELCSLNALHTALYIQWRAKNVRSQLLPIYLKNSSTPTIPSSQ